MQKEVNQIQLAFTGASVVSRLQICLLIIQFPEEITGTPDAKCPLNWCSSREWCGFFFFFFTNTVSTKEGYCIFKSPTKKKKKKKKETYSFVSSMLLFQYSSLLVPPPHIIKHIIITWLSACVSLRSILALPGNQFVVTLCNPSKVIKWNELQLQRAFKNTGGRGGGKGRREKKKTREKWQHGPGIFHRLIAHPRSWRWNINAQFVYLQAHISPVPSC